MPGERLDFGFLDIFSLITLLFFSVRGWFKGIAKELCGIMGLVLGLSAALRYSSSFSSFLGKNFPSISSFSNVIAFVVLFLAVLIFFSVLGGFLSKFFKAIWLGWFDRLGGLLFGLAEGAFIVSIIFWGISLLPEIPILEELKRGSLAYKVFEFYALPYLKEMVSKLKWK